MAKVNRGRISLPTYPFARERYWVPEVKTNETTGRGIATAIHPFLQQNTSDLAEQRYSTTFSGGEFFLADHVVGGRRVLPEVVYLEMARAAVAAATGALAEDRRVVRLKNVVWAGPITVAETPLHIGLYPADHGAIAYEVYSLAEPGAATVYSQGSATLAEAAAVKVLDLQAIQGECRQRNLTALEIYNAFTATGLGYGPGYRVIETIAVGPDQTLVKLSLPAAVAATAAQFSLHPSIMVGVGQALAVLREYQPLQLVALEELEVINQCTANMWAVIHANTSAAAPKFDIDLCDETGTVGVRLSGLAIQAAAISAETPHPDRLIDVKQETHQLMTFEEVWQTQALPEKTPVKLKQIVCFLSHPENQQTVIQELQALAQPVRVIFITQAKTFQKQTPEQYGICRTEGQTYQAAFQSIRAEIDSSLPVGEVDALMYLWALEDASCIEDYSAIVYLLQAMVATKLKVKRILLGAQFKNDLERCHLESWIGFERSLGLTLPDTQLAAVYQETGPLKDWIGKLWAELQSVKFQSVWYQKGKRQVCQIRATTITSANRPIKPGGTYLITGGCGGLGLLFAQHLAQAQPVNLILSGRSALNSEKQRKIKALEDLGGTVSYIQADVGDVRGHGRRIETG